MSDPVAMLAGALEAAGIPPASSPFRASGKIERFTPKGDSQENGWYVLYPLTACLVGAFGCWKRGIKQKFCSADRSTLSPAQWNEVSQAWRKAEAARAAEEAAAATAVRDKCKTLFAGPKAAAHPYLEKKRVRARDNLALSNLTAYPGWLAIPLVDEHGVIHSAQLIAEDGQKRFMFGGRIAGCFAPIAPEAAGPLCIVEGYSTGATVHEATGWPVFCAMSAGNLAAVSAALRKLHPERPILLCADHDQFTPSNPGLTKATAAAKAVRGTVIYPQFSDEELGSKPTDWNDLQYLAGSEETKRQLLAGAKMGGDWSLLLSDGAETMTEVLPDPVQIVEGFLCEEAKMVIGGSSKTYKTWLTMDLALSVATGAPFLGHACHRRNVLYVNFELKESTFKKRIQAVTHAKNLLLDYQQFYHLSLRGRVAKLKSSEIVDKIIALALDKRCSVVVVDPIYKLNTQGTDENSAGQQTVFLNELDRITTEAKCSLVFDDHFSKGNQSDKDPLDAIRGSSAKGGDVDAAFIIRKHTQDGSFSVDVVHRELPPMDPFVITWNYPLFHMEHSLDPGDMKQPNRGGRPKTIDPMSILAAFKETTPENGTTVSKLVKILDISRSAIRTHLSFLRSQSWIATHGEGTGATQHITDAGKAHLLTLP